MIDVVRGRAARQSPVLRAGRLRPAGARRGRGGRGGRRGRARGGEVSVHDVGDSVGRHGGHGRQKVVRELHAARLVHPLVRQLVVEPHTAEVRFQLRRRVRICNGDGDVRISPISVPIAKRAVQTVMLRFVGPERCKVSKVIVGGGLRRGPGGGGGRGRGRGRGRGGGGRRREGVGGRERRRAEVRPALAAAAAAAAALLGLPRCNTTCRLLPYCIAPDRTPCTNPITYSTPQLFVYLLSSYRH